MSKHNNSLRCERVPAMTTSQREIFELVKVSPTPIKAYDLLRALSLRKGRVSPPTIYRALNALTQMGLIHRIESLNAFSACVHESQCNHVFLLCGTCGRAEEVAAQAVTETLSAVCASADFSPERVALEVRGACHGCRPTTDI